jgi:S-adenosylmethionine uptake transporter
MSNKISAHTIGALWFILSLLSSSINDIISRYTGLYMPTIEVAFFRFLFTVLTLLPFIIYNGLSSIKSEKPLVHIARGVLLYFGITAWTHGLSLVPVVTATVISFTVPLFTLILALLFLNEKVTWQRWLATILGFLGIIIILRPDAGSFNPYVLVFLISSLGFAGIDILNKKYVLQETMLGMLFYSALVTTILSAPGVAYVWVWPSLSDLLLLFILGASANLILFFLLKAFAIEDATALAPYRYLELLISTILGFILLKEIPGIHTFYGAIIIIPTSLFIVYSENNKLKDATESKISEKEEGIAYERNSTAGK